MHPPMRVMAVVLLFHPAEQTGSAILPPGMARLYLTAVDAANKDASGPLCGPFPASSLLDAEATAFGHGMVRIAPWKTLPNGERLLLMERLDLDFGFEADT